MMICMIISGNSNTPLAWFLPAVSSCWMC